MTCGIRPVVKLARPATPPYFAAVTAGTRARRKVPV